MSDNHSVINITNLYKSYHTGKNEVPVLKNLNITIKKNEYVIIKGPSGSGKSTFMNIIGCLDRPTQGTYHLDGRTVDELSDSELAEVRGKTIGFVFQSFNLIPRLSAIKNVELPLFYMGKSAGERRYSSEKVLTRLGLGHRLTHPPHELSGGEKQRVAIARALVINPALILADEPTGNVDSKSGKDILNIFDEIRNEMCTIVMVTHDEQVAQRGSRVITLRDGQIEGDMANG